MKSAAHRSSVVSAVRLDSVRARVETVAELRGHPTRLAKRLVRLAPERDSTPVHYFSGAFLEVRLLDLDLSHPGIVSGGPLNRLAVAITRVPWSTDARSTTDPVRRGGKPRAVRSRSHNGHSVNLAPPLMLLILPSAGDGNCSRKTVQPGGYNRSDSNRCAFSPTPRLALRHSLRVGVVSTTCGSCP